MKNKLNDKKLNEKNWWDTKRYLHIGLPPTMDEKKRWMCEKIQNPEFISSHSFLPLIRRIIKTRRYRKVYKVDELPKRKYSTKEREICYACHFDSMVYRYYAEKLQEKYEEILRANPTLSKSVVAYRQLQIDESKPELGNKCNIDFANDAFQYIKQSTEDELFVGIYDITNFFNSLDHQLLKLSWLSICRFKRGLPKDHYAVYKNTIKYSYINEEAIFDLFKDRIICQKKSSKDFIRRKIRKSVFLYNKKKNAVAYCRKEDLKEIKSKRLIHNNKQFLDEHFCLTPRNKGIPQGLPISAVLANIYMLIFDELLVEYITEIGGIYRRYSDDIIIICKLEYKESIRELLHAFIKFLKLEIQEKKENEFILTKDEKGYLCKGIRFPYKTKLEYLGFEFDGKKILLKSASLSGFYSRMDKAVKRSSYFSKNIKNETKGHIFRNQLFRRFTTYGSKKKRIYKQKRTASGKISHTYIGKKSWGNYITYVKRASKSMNEHGIHRQLKRHLPILRKKLDAL